MGNYRYIDPSAKEKIYTLSLTENQTNTAKKLHVSQSTVSRLKARVLATGTMAKDRKGVCGRPRLLNGLDLTVSEYCSFSLLADPWP